MTIKCTTLLALFSILLFINGGESHKIFTSDITIRVTNGKYQAKLYYLYNETSGSNYHVMRLDYSSPLSMTDLINYGENVRYKVCTKCEAGFHSARKYNISLFYLNIYLL